jgi:hypothetical protein
MKFLTRPGRAKKRLWQVCLHEAAHGLACSYFLNIPSTCRVFHRGGTCQRLRSSSAGPAAHAIYTMAGDAGASLAQLADCNRIPAGRPRFGRERFRRRERRLANDAQNVERILQSSGPLKEDPELARLCREKWEQTAMNFVICRRKLIVEIATKLYLAGRVYVSARDLNDCDWAADYVAGR